MMLTRADLVDVLLLPSLVPAILYLSNQLWAGGPQIQSAIIKILQVILRPGSMSNEASAMLSSVLNIVAKPLEHALRSYQRQAPESQEVEPLLGAIKDNLPLSRRTGGADHKELESWCSVQVSNAANGSVTHGGISAAVRQTIQSLIQWAQQPPLQGMPPPYTHRQILAALRMLGAKRLLGTLLDELKAFTETPQASIAYDVVTAIICAPDVTNDTSLAAAAAPAPSPSGGGGGGGGGNSNAADATMPGGEPPPLQRRMLLREALKAEMDDWKRLRSSDPLLAETVVRLHRRVEAQMALPPPSAAVDAATAAAAAAMLQPELGGLGGATADGVLGDAIAAAAAAGAGPGEHGQGHGHDGMALDGSGLDGSGGVPDLAADLSQAGGGTGGGGGSGAGGGGAGGGSGTGTGGLDLGGDDIFGGLSGTNEFGAEFAAWDMDLT